MEWVVQPYLQPQGCLVDLATGIRNVTPLPILTVGRINDPAIAESILQTGAADFVSMGRALIADPDFPSKAKEGKTETICPCIACNVCIEAVGTKPTRCAVNPEMGREHESRPASQASHSVLVVGGGPAGMEVALRANALGHQVKLVEASQSLGGQLRLAGIPASKASMRHLLAHFRHAIARSGIELSLDRAFDIEMLQAFRPDHVILATGAIPKALPGVSEGRQTRVIQAVTVLDEAISLQGHVVIVGGGLVGLDVAEFLACRGADVTVMEMQKQVGSALEWNVRKMKLKDLAAKGVTIRTRSRVLEVADGHVRFAGPEGKARDLSTDTAVIAVGSSSYNPCEQAVRDMGVRVTRIGDCREPGDLADAIAEGFETAVSLSHS
jgi:NADPH-dependent 2,4-dienoyl-CoA reductase/sulfur reductase-like enzyme